MHLTGRSDGQGRRSHPGNGEIRLARRGLGRHGLSFPNRQATDGSLLESLIVADCTNDFGEATAGFNKVELSSLSGFIGGERTRDARCIAGELQSWNRCGRAN